MAGHVRPTGPRPGAGGGGSLEEFKARLPLAEIVGRYVKLTRRGREWTGLCPFHAEKTPSFSVVEDKGFYHCFGCGAHGDAVAFVMAVERLEFREAIERLAELSGIPAPRRAGPEATRVDPTLFDANGAAAVWYAARLLDPDAAAARAYLERRGLDRDTVREFRLGWAPADRGALRRALEAQGFTTERLLAAGLLRLPEGGGEPYALLRERVVFPIADGRGRIVGFGGRTLGDGQPKYLNTPDTELFHKGRLLYGLDRAAEPARRGGRLVVAEGYMDVIALDRAGFPAVAPLGTAMGEEQLERCWRLVDRPTICLDGDAAGLRAALRLAERAAPLLRPDRSLGFVVLPEGEDPDSLLRNRGREALADELARPEPLVSFVFRTMLKHRAQQLDRVEERAALRRSLRDFVTKVVDPDLRSSVKEIFDERLREILQKRHRQVTQLLSPPNQIGRIAVRQKSDPLWFVPILKDPSILGAFGAYHAVDEEFSRAPLPDPVHERMRQEILTFWSQNIAISAETLRDHLIERGFSILLADVTSKTKDLLRPEDRDRSALDQWRTMFGEYYRREVKRQEADAIRRHPDPRSADELFEGLNRTLNACEEEE